VLRKNFGRIIGSTICVVLALPFSSASAINKPAASNSEIEKLKGQLEYVSKQESTEIQKYLSLKSESQKASANLAAVDQKIRDAEARKKAAQDEANVARTEYAAAEKKYNDALQDSKEAKERKKRAIVRLYQKSTDTDAIPSVLSSSPEDRQEVIRKSTLIKKYNDNQLNAIGEADVKADNAAAEKLLFEDARLRAEDAEKVAQAEEDSLVPLRLESAATQKKAKESENAASGIVNSLKSKKSSYNAQIAQLVAESNALAEQIRRKQNTTIIVAPGRMIRPVSAGINSPFGYRTHPIYGDARLHAGIDFGASYGTAIKAAKSGTVIFAGSMSGYGNVIIIDHGGGLSTLYAHQSSFAVGLNVSVVQGQTIGYVGASGQVTGAHLHFEVRSNGTPVDPMGYF